MTRGKPIAITKSVLHWAISESGFEPDALAQAIGVAPSTLSAWLDAREQPTLTELRALAAQLKRPLATFLLPRPPRLPRPSVEFRAPPGGGRAELNVAERRRIREAARLQRMLAWITRELGRSAPVLPRVTINSRQEASAEDTRTRLGIMPQQQELWRSASAALHGWRTAVERTGVFVLMLPMGEDSARGFSLWDEQAPLVALNTSWSAEARIFTLFHEYAHLLTRTSSACLEGAYRWPTAKADPTERWCEEFAANVIIPRPSLEAFLTGEGLELPVTDTDTVGRIARRFRASMRATALRLIGLDAATWGLYKSLPPLAERKPAGGGGAGRSRAQIRRDQYGPHTSEVFTTALQKDVVNRADILDYLNVPSSALGGTATPDQSTFEQD
jgi:Zn-dependent peptidase ImmA (M78 family)